MIKDDKNIEEKKKFLVNINSGGRVISYLAQIIEDKNDFIKLRDKFNKIIQVNKRFIISLQELEDE